MLEFNKRGRVLHAIPHTSAYTRLKGLSHAGDPLLLGFLHRDFVRLDGIATEVKVYLKNAFIPGRHGPKFLIFGRMRSGTTLLCHLLDKVPDIHCEREMLHNKVLFPRRYLNQLARKREATAYGCKILSYQLPLAQRVGHPERLFSELAEDGFKFIHIVRNTLDQCLSGANLRTARRDRLGMDADQAAKDGESGRLEIDPEAFVRRVRWNLALLQIEREILAPYPHEIVVYERDLADSAAHQALIDRLSAYIGVPTAPVGASMRKVIAGGFEENVANAAEVRAALAAAGLEEALDLERAAG